MTRNKHEHDATELALAFRLIARRLRSEVPAETSELSWTQMAVMRRLETEGPATTADLARAEAMKPQSMGTAIAALEDMGMVKRKAHPTDGRQVNIELTERGARVRKDARIAKETWLAQAIGKLEPTEQKHLPAVTKLIKRLAEL